LLCTHDLREAEVLADRVGILDRGRLIALDPPDVLKDEYDADTLEEAFFAATGRAFEEEEDEDAERGVFA
jgi:ABC-2 type transport system ATP-binding protein